MAKTVDLTPREERDLFTSENLNQPITEMLESANQNDAEAGVREGCFRDQHLPSLLGSVTNPGGATYFGASGLTITPTNPGDSYSQSQGDMSPYFLWGEYNGAAGPSPVTRTNNGWLPLETNGPPARDLELDFRGGSTHSEAGINLDDASEQNIDGVLVLFNCRLNYINGDFSDEGALSQTDARDRVGFTLQFLSDADELMGAHVNAWRPLGYSERFYQRGSGNWLFVTPGGTEAAPPIYEGELFRISPTSASIFRGWGKHSIDISIRILLTKDVLLTGANEAYVAQAIADGRPVVPNIKKIRACVCLIPWNNGTGMGAPSAWSTGIGGGGTWGENPPEAVGGLGRQTTMKCTIDNANLSAIALQSGKIITGQ
jgi:hypothetical protein